MLPPKDAIEAARERLEVFIPSQEEGRAMTGAALRKGIRLQPVITAATDTAAYVDEAISVIREEYNPPLDCREACWYCCCHPQILVSVPELLRIVDLVRRTFTEEQIAELKTRAQAYTAQLQGRTLASLAKQTPIPCPLLVNERCSVYEARPLECRAYNSMDANACRKDYEDASSSIPLFSLVKDAADGALVGSVQALRALGLNDAVVDLGRALDIALNHDGNLEDFIARRDLLRLVEDRKWAPDRWRAVRQQARALGMNA